jgi:hypothetical protein
MSVPIRRLVQTISTIINTTPNINVTVRNQLIENLNTFNREISDILLEIALENNMYKKRIDKLEYDIRLLHVRPVLVKANQGAII